MLNVLKSAWDDYVRPALRRPNRLQVAALCHRGQGDKKEVLLVTSRGTGRWIIPKGWPITGLESSEAALQEAWEEAGVTNGKIRTESVGTYHYEKTLPYGWALPVETLVFSVDVRELCDDFPESSERQRKWVSPTQAANMVQEPELKTILRKL